MKEKERRSFQHGMICAEDFMFFKFFVFNCPVESIQESCEKLAEHFYKEGQLAVLLQLEEGRSANVKFLEMEQTKGKSLMVKEAGVGGLIQAGSLRILEGNGRHGGAGLGQH